MGVEPFLIVWSMCVIGIGSVLDIRVGISHRNFNVIEFTRFCTISWICEKTGEYLF